jgi:general stress protein YciG
LYRATREEISMSDNNFEHRSLNVGRKPSDSNTGEQMAADGPSNGGQSEPERAPKPASRRGFAAMDEQTQREIARKGGHSQGKENNRGNFWHDRERARIAGRKGGEAHGKNRQELATESDRH